MKHTTQAFFLELKKTLTPFDYPFHALMSFLFGWPVLAFLVPFSPFSNWAITAIMAFFWGVMASIVIMIILGGFYSFSRRFTYNVKKTSKEFQKVEIQKKEAQRAPEGALSLVEVDQNLIGALSFPEESEEDDYHNSDQLELNFN